MFTRNIISSVQKYVTICCISRNIIYVFIANVFEKSFLEIFDHILFTFVFLCTIHFSVPLYDVDKKHDVLCSKICNLKIFDHILFTFMFLCTIHFSVPLYYVHKKHHFLCSKICNHMLHFQQHNIHMYSKCILKCHFSKYLTIYFH